MGKLTLINLSGHEYGAEHSEPENASRRELLKRAGLGIAAITLLAGCNRDGKFGYSHPDFKDMGSIPTDLVVTNQEGGTGMLTTVIDEAAANALRKNENGALAERTQREPHPRDVYIVSFGFSACSTACITIGSRIAHLDQNSGLPIIMLQVWPGFDDPASSVDFARTNYAKHTKDRLYDPKQASWQIVGCPPSPPPRDGETPEEELKRDRIKDSYMWAVESIMGKLALENNTTRDNPAAYPEKGYQLLPGQRPGKGFHFSESEHAHGEHVNVVLMVDRATNRILKSYNALLGTEEALTKEIVRDAALHRIGQQVASLQGSGPVTRIG